jgi:co-chaperonin GroES (HSP10)
MPDTPIKIRKISPFGFRVVVRLMKQPNTTEGGLYLPEGTTDKMADSVLAQVIEVASARDEDGDEMTNVSGIPLGATVLIKKDAGVRIPWEKECRIIDTQEVLALVEEILVT